MHFYNHKKYQNNIILIKDYKKIQLTKLKCMYFFIKSILIYELNQ